MIIDNYNKYKELNIISESKLEGTTPGPMREVIIKDNSVVGLCTARHDCGTLVVQFKDTKEIGQVNPTTVKRIVFDNETLKPGVHINLYEENENKGYYVVRTFNETEILIGNYSVNLVVHLDKLLLGDYCIEIIDNPFIKEIIEFNYSFKDKEFMYYKDKLNVVESAGLTRLALREAGSNVVYEVSSEDLDPSFVKHSAVFNKSAFNKNTVYTLIQHNHGEDPSVRNFRLLDICDKALGFESSTNGTFVVTVEDYVSGRINVVKAESIIKIY